eukprot:5910706-Pleurochrysis_carterae.AAC.2
MRSSRHTRKLQTWPPPRVQSSDTRVRGHACIGEVREVLSQAPSLAPKARVPLAAPSIWTCELLWVGRTAPKTRWSLPLLKSVIAALPAALSALPPEPSLLCTASAW